MNREFSRNHAHQLAAFLTRQLTVLRLPIFVALDGRSGSGKSTMATLVADELNSGGSDIPIMTVIEGDQFYGGGSLSTWDLMSVEQKLDRVIDWRRQRKVLESLRNQEVAVWHAFNWESEDWDTDRIPVNPEPQRCIATSIILLEGVYSARPEIADLLDFRFLLEIPKVVRLTQLLTREGEAYQDDWQKHWSEVEAYYFGSVVSASEFDQVFSQ